MLVMDVYLSCIQGPSGELLIALGYFKYEKCINIIGMTLNIICSIIGSLRYGLYGILIGTIISQVVMWLGKQAIVLKLFFQQTIRKICVSFERDILRAICFGIYIVIGYYFIQAVSLTNLLLETMVQFLVAEIIISISLFITLELFKEGKYIREFLGDLKAKNKC